MNKIDLSDAPESPMPQAVKPMLATLIEEPFDRDGWIFEIKWDGYRLIAMVRNGQADIYSRNQILQNYRYPEIARELAGFDFEAVLDGEIVVLDKDGISNFQLLQSYESRPQGQLRYFVFDIIYLNGHDLRGLPLIRRKSILKQILPQNPRVIYCDHVETHGEAFYRLAVERGLEGTVGKRMESVYREGIRSRDWLKIRARLREELVVGGFTEPRGGRQHLGALLLGAYEGDKLVYFTHAGGRLSDADLAELRRKLAPTERKDSPFSPVPKSNAPVHWVEPQMVVEIEFSGWTEDGHIRQPVVLGVREDKSAKEVQRYEARIAEPVASKDSQIIQFGSRKVTLSNLTKVYWPEEGYTKGDLISYYRRMSSLVLPYLEDRPESLHRYPEGIYGQHFFQKNVGEVVPEWIPTVKVFTDSEQREIVYMLVQDEAALLYMINLGCIEINPWLSRKQALENPDYVVIDLDPDGGPFEWVIKAAHVVKGVLDEIGVPSYPKTSGLAGMHIYIPLAAKYSYQQARQFAQLVALVASRRAPEITTVERSPKYRGGKIYLDYLQNRRGQTLATAYCVRPVKGATVSAPLLWEEVNDRLDPSQFNLTTMEARVERLGDPFAPVLGSGIDLKMTLDRMIPLVEHR